MAHVLNMYLKEFLSKGESTTPGVEVGDGGGGVLSSRTCDHNDIQFNAKKVSRKLKEFTFANLVYLNTGV